MGTPIEHEFLDWLVIEQRKRSAQDWARVERVLTSLDPATLPISAERLNILRTRCQVRAVQRAPEPQYLSDASLAQVVRVRWEDSEQYRDAVMAWVERNPTAGQHLWLTLRETRWCQRIVDANHVAFLADLFLRQAPDDEGLRIVREFAHEEQPQTRYFEGLDNERMLQEQASGWADEEYAPAVHRWVQERAPSEIADLVRIIQEHVRAGVVADSDHYGNVLLEVYMCWGQPDEAEYDRLIAILDLGPQK